MKNMWANFERAMKFSATSPIRADASNLTAEQFAELFANSGRPSSGVNVSERVAMANSVVLSCTNLIAGAIASMPLHIYERTADGKKLRVPHQYWWLLNEKPNGEMTWAVMVEYLIQSLLLNGDAFAEILRPNAYTNTAIGFYPHHKNSVTVQRISDGKIMYRVTDWDGTQRVISPADMIHVPGAGFDGLTGMSACAHWLRQPVGIAVAAEDHTASFFNNGARPDFVLEVDTSLDEEQQKVLLASWDDRHQGVSRSHRPALLTDGLKIKPISVSAQDSQLMAQRNYQVVDIARIFGVPPHLIGHTEGVSVFGSGMANMGQALRTFTLARLLTKFEQEFNSKLWPNREKYFVEFNASGLERGDNKSRNESYRIALGRAGEAAWMTVNEVRALENLPPIEGGDVIKEAVSAGSKFTETPPL